MADLVKIKSYIVRASGKRGFAIAIPQVWSDDQGLKPDDALDIFRGGPEDSLIIRKRNNDPIKKDEDTGGAA